MSSYQESKIFYVNSLYRLSGTTGSFSFKLNIPAGTNFDRVCVLQANVPISYYMVPEGSNSFVLKEGEITATITVPVGNYNVNSFNTILTGLLNTTSPNGWTYSMTFPTSFSQPSTGKYTYNVSGNGTTQPQFIITDSLFELLGFGENTTVTFVDNTLTSERVVKFIPEDSLYLHSDIVDDENSILQELFHDNSVPFGNATYVCPDVQGYSKKMKTNQSNVYTFSLCDEHGHQLNLNGIQMLFTLILFRRETFPEMIRSYMKYNLLKE